MRIEKRWAIVGLCFMAMLSIYVERVGFSIAYTAIAAAANIEETTKGLVLGAFFNGYGLSQIPGGWAAHRYGGKVVLSWSFLSWSLLSLAMPAFTHSTALMVAIRVAMGIAQGFVVPSVHTVLAEWIPPQERATATSLSTSGMYLGSTTAMIVLPWLASAMSPSAILVLAGCLGLGWAAVWSAMGSDGPGGNLPITNGGASPDADESKKPARRRPSGAPWGRMLQSPAVLAIIVNNFTFHYALYILMNWMPTYFSQLLGTDLASMGAAKSVPYLAIFLFSISAGYMGDWLIVQRRLPVAMARKLINTAGFASAAITLLFIPEARAVGSAVGLVAWCFASIGFARGGFSVNHMDIAPRFAGAVMGVSNTAGTIAGVVGLPVTGYLLQSAGGAANPAGWRSACAAASALCAGGSIVFLAFGRGQRVLD